MALPASGQISINDIRIELGIPSGTNLTMSGLPNGSPVAINIWSPSKPSTSAPYSLSQWYSYNHTAPAPNLATFEVIGTTDPIYGGFLASWTESGGLAIASYELRYSFDYGATWPLFDNYGQGVYDSGYQSLDGLVGFTSRDNTYFKLVAKTYGIEVPGSPKFAYPPFPY